MSLSCDPPQAESFSSETFSDAVEKVCKEEWSLIEIINGKN